MASYSIQGRFVRALAWILLFMTIGLAVVTRYYMVVVPVTNKTAVGTAYSALTVVHAAAGSKGPVVVQRGYMPWSVWWPYFSGVSRGGNWGAGVPWIWLGMPCLATLAVERVVRRPRRRTQDRCAGCGYSLEGLAGERCPECGQARAHRSRE